MALWTSVAISDMRIPGYGGSYATSYAATDDTWWLRNTNSSQNRKASLVQGRYATPAAFTSTNPDYAAELTGFSGAITQTTWTRIQYWNHLVLTGTYQDNHTSGWENNTRVMIWDAQIWVKSLATGQWTRRYFSDTPSGNVWTPNFAVPFNPVPPNADYKIETSTGYPSIRLISYTDDNNDPSYYFWHGTGSITNIDPYDVADVVVSTKISLVLNDPDGEDDRAASRFMFACGADYYPESTLRIYPGVGTSKHKIVTAQWPDFQYSIMHTMTESQFNAAGGYPSAFSGLSEGDSGSGGGGGTDPPPTTEWVFAPPSVSEWADQEVSGDANFTDYAVSNTAPTVVGGAFPADEDNAQELPMLIKQSESVAGRRTINFVVRNSADDTPYTSTLSGSDLMISKADGAEAASAGTATHVGNGKFKYTFTTGEVDTFGELVVRIAKTGTWGTIAKAQVIALDLYDAAAAGLSRMDAAVSTRLASADYEDLATQLDEASTVETGMSIRGFYRLVASVLLGKVSGAGTGTNVFRNAVADTKARVTSTVDTSGNRTAVTTDQT